MTVQTAPERTCEATIEKVIVSIKALRVDGKRMTIAMLKQIQEDVIGESEPFSFVWHDGCPWYLFVDESGELKKTTYRDAVDSARDRLTDCGALPEDRRVALQASQERSDESTGYKAVTQTVVFRCGGYFEPRLWSTDRFYAECERCQNQRKERKNAMIVLLGEVDQAYISV